MAFGIFSIFSFALSIASIKIKSLIFAMVLNEFRLKLSRQKLCTGLFNLEKHEHLLQQKHRLP